MTAIKTYLNSLSDDITTLDISGKSITSLPDLTRFKNLEKFNCSYNQLTSLTLPQNLKILDCDNNKLTSLTLPQNLEVLNCYHNQLTSLTLPQNLEIVHCNNNKLTSLTLPQNLQVLYCSNNQLTSLTLQQNLRELDYYNNPIYEIVNNDSLIKIKQNIQILNNFRYLYYSLKFKKQLRKWLWEKVREPKIKKLYDPIYLINLKEDDDLDTFLDNWK